MSILSVDVLKINVFLNHLRNPEEGGKYILSTPYSLSSKNSALHSIAKILRSF